METPETFDVPKLRAAMQSLLGEGDFYPTQIELKHPRILAKVIDMWGGPALDAYLGELMVSDRPNRQGFSGDVAREIFRLSTLHGALGLSKEGSGTGWAGINDPESHRGSRL